MKIGWYDTDTTPVVKGKIYMKHAVVITMILALVAITLGAGFSADKQKNKTCPMKATQAATQTDAAVACACPEGCSTEAGCNADCTQACAAKKSAACGTGDAKASACAKAGNCDMEACICEGNCACKGGDEVCKEGCPCSAEGACAKKADKPAGGCGQGGGCPK